ncbi:MAG: PEP-CTERM sorting domain-containing protein [Phycisphaerae bacterium]
MARTQQVFRLLVLMGALTVVWIPWPAQAEMRTWTGADDKEWFNADDWNPVGLPDPSDDLTINSGTPETADDVTTDSDGSITVTEGAHATFDNDLVVGDSGAGTLNVEADGRVSNAQGYLGFGLGSTGMAAVTGDGSTWLNHSLYVGYEGAGTLNVEAGGQVGNDNGCLGFESVSTGTATVTGGGSAWTNSGTLSIGWNGTGTLNVEAAGQVGTHRGEFGCCWGSTGTATVTGEDSTWTNFESLTVGLGGEGTLTIEAGGQVSTLDACVGFFPGSTGTATVTGEDSTWTHSESLCVGLGGEGTLNVEAGGQVTSTDGYLGVSSGSNATVTVDGNGSVWRNTAGLYVGGGDVGSGGGGSVTVRNGGHLLAGEVLKLWKTDGQVTVNAGTLTAGALEGTTGTIRITNPAGEPALTVGSPDSGTFSGALLDDTSPGSLTKMGTGTQVLAGVGIAYTGATAVLDGTLRLTDSTSFVSPMANDATVEFQATSGTWTLGSTLGGGGTFVKSGNGTLVLSGLQYYDPGALFEILAGTVEMNTDASGTGLVADADLSVLVTDATLTFGCNQHLDTLELGDGGRVRLAGANVVVVKHLIMNGLDVGGATLTPEPATLALVALGALGVLLRRRIATPINKARLE